MSRRHTSRFAAVCAAVVSAVVSVPAQGAVLGADAFRVEATAQPASGIYGAAALATQTANVTGFPSSNPWTAINDEFGRYTVEAGGLTYTDAGARSLAVDGGRVRYVRNNGSGNASIKSASRLTSYGAPDVATTYYASFLVNVASFNNTNPDLALMAVRFGATSGNQVVFGLREGLAVIGTGNLDLQSSFTATASSAGSFATGTTHLLVMKIVAGVTGNDTITLYANPTDLSDESQNTAVATTSALNLLEDSGSTFSAWSLYSNASSAAANPVLFDEMRVGTSFTEVLPVPEPGTLGAVGLALLGLGRRWRR